MIKALIWFECLAIISTKTVTTAQKKSNYYILENVNSPTRDNI